MRTNCSKSASPTNTCSSAPAFLMINTFYFLNLIPPVPLALEKGFVAYNVKKSEDTYEVTYENMLWYQFWNDDYRIHSYTEDSDVFVFTSILRQLNLQQLLLTSGNGKIPIPAIWKSPIASSMRLPTSGTADTAATPIKAV